MMQGMNSSGHPSATSSQMDSAQFSGENIRQGLGRDLKVKIVFILLSIAFVLGSAAYVRHRVGGMNLGGKAAETNQDALAQRKAKVFEVDESAKKPPIVLPTDAKPGLPPTLPASASVTVGLPIGLGSDDWQVRKPLPNTPNTPTLPTVSATPGTKGMMLGDGTSVTYPQTGASPASGKATGASAPGGVDLGALLGINTNGGNKLGLDALGLITSPGTASATNPAPSGTGKNNAQTIEAQALIARDKAGSQVTATAQVSASKLGRRSFVLSKGAFIPCVLETQLVSNVFGMASCVVTHNVYSDDGKVLLIERGSRVTGNYGSNLRNGDSRLAVIWDRIKTPKGITVDVNSPATDGAGAMGLPGVVDKHWFERIAGAILLSLVQDTIQYATSSIAYRTYLKEQKENANTQLPVQMGNTNSSTVTTTSIDPVTGDTITTVTHSGQSPVAQAARNSNGNPPPVPVFGGTNTSKQGASIPEQVLSASINAAPTLSKNRGEVVYIFVANDLWFDRVYGLKE